MLDPDSIDRDAPIGAARLRNSGPRKGSLAHNGPLAGKQRGGAWKPFAGAAAIALVAAGLATVIVQALAPGDGDQPASAPARQAASAPARQASAPPAPQVAIASPPARLPAAPAPEPARINPPQQAAAAPPAAPLEASPPPVVPQPPVASATPAPVAPAPVTAPLAEAPAATEAVGAVATGALKLSPEDVLSSLEKGEGKLKLGDVASARRYFERVALAGDARGATAMGRTYDPDVLAKLPVIGLEPDPAAAATWYDKARTLKAGP